MKSILIICLFLGIFVLSVVTEEAAKDNPKGKIEVLTLRTPNAAANSEKLNESAAKVENIGAKPATDNIKKSPATAQDKISAVKPIKTK